ncbi:MAG TPA: VOC family protein [Methanoregulaceae archaeon]|nr:VOC family protein [Methanoregulaceae archaeon]HOV67706.1 VOC family protein [Methanoregulaceae archaeon]HQJ87274.1 VOC family protein [Methanoregulaceae archaeon]
MPRVVLFECHADDPERVAAFYRDVFGWEIERTEDPYYILLRSGGTGEPGIDGAVMPRVRGSSFTNLVSVTSIDDTMLRCIRAGGEVLMPRRSVSGVGRVAYCADAEGNVFGLLEQVNGQER